MNDKTDSVQNPWISVRETLPEEHKVVMTKIDDSDGVRNEQPLKRMHNLWWTPDSAMYVYYNPTHWHPIDTQTPKS